jgi:hypothetical protein
MNLAVLSLAALIASPALSAPTRYRYGKLLVEFKGQALISEIPLGTLGRIPIPVLRSFVVQRSLNLAIRMSSSLITDTVTKLQRHLPHPNSRSNPNPNPNTHPKLPKASG